MRTVPIAPDHGEIGRNTTSSGFVQFVMVKVSLVPYAGMEPANVLMLNIAFMYEAVAIKQCMKGLRKVNRLCLW